MECPRCGSALTGYALGRSEAVVCEECGYVDVPVDHLPEPDAGESWEEALRRFYERTGGDR